MHLSAATSYTEAILPSSPPPAPLLPASNRSNTSPATMRATFADVLSSTSDAETPPHDPEEEELRKAFYSFVGQTLFGQLLRAMRNTVGRPAYFYGSRVEKIFQQQLDQVLAEKISEAAADRLAEPMFQLFNLRRS